MGLDIRLPIGLLFSLIGILLVAFGALSNKAIYMRSLNYNINLIWGAALLFFGLVMLAFGYLGPRRNSRREI
jgi:drug/metabolite transporter (DMT)-like permease